MIKTIKHTQEYITNFYLENGYILKSIYINNKTKDSLLCPEGHEIKLKFSHFQQGTRCTQCYGNVKFTYDYIKEYIESFGYKLLSKEYINARTNLTVECLNKHVYEVNFNNIKIGKRCRKCYFNNNVGENHWNWNSVRTRHSRIEYLSFDQKKKKILINDLNYSKYINSKDYHIDHIYPRVAFIDNNLDEIYNKKLIKKICNSRDNLRIILKEENGSKAAKYNQEEFINWFTNELILELMNI